MPKLTDFLGNEISVKQFASIELAQPIHSVKGQIQEIEIGGVSTLHTPKQGQGQMKPTRILVMCPVEILLDPRAESAPHIMIAKEPPQEEKPAAES